MAPDGLRGALRRPAGRLGLVALLVYLPGFWWGAPRAQNDQSIRSWGVDDEAPIGPLAQIHNVIEPKEVQNLGYPLMHSFMTGAAYAPYLGVLWLTGDFERPSGEYPYGLADPVRSLRVLTWIAHLLSVLLGAATVVAAALIAGRLWGEREAWWAGGFTLLSYPMFYYARTGNVDGPALFFMAAALVPFASILTDGIDVRRTAWLGLWVGFACATKEQSAALFLGVPAVLAWLAWRDARRPRRRSASGVPYDAGTAPASRGSTRRRRLGLAPGHWTAFGVGLVACVLAFGLGSGLFVAPDRFFAHLAFNAERIEMLRRGEIAFMTYYERDLAGNIALLRLLGGYLADALTLPGIALAAAGLAVTFRRRSAAAWMAIPALTYLLVLFWATRNGQLRYVMPASFVLGLFAARGVGAALDAARQGDGWKRTALRWTALGAAGWIVIAGALRGIDLTQQMIRDSRWEATAWLEARLGPDDRIDFFGPDAKLPWLPYGVAFERANQYLGAVYPPGRGQEDAERIRARWEELRPDVILVMPDVSSREGEPHNATLPPEVFDDLLQGRLGYELAVMFRTPRLFPWLSIPELDYPSVNPPIRLFVPSASEGGREAEDVGR